MASVTIDRSRLERMLRLPGGLVERNIRRRTERVADEARRLAPGSMSEQITTRVDRAGREVQGHVISNHFATQFVIKGTRPHQIRPVRAQALRFTVGGRVVYAKLVNHPGTDPNNFLAEALRRAL